VSTLPGDRARSPSPDVGQLDRFQGTEAGIARVILDGTVVADSHRYVYPLPSEAPNNGLHDTGPGSVKHSLTIEVTGSKNPASAALRS